MWVSNLVPVNENQGIICVWTDLCNLNLEGPKDNHLFLSSIILPDAFAGHEILFFMDGFAEYNQIQIHKEDQYKTTFTTLGHVVLPSHAIQAQERWFHLSARHVTLFL